MQEPARAVSALAERVVSERGLALVFLLGATYLALVSWVRPPLSPDLASYHIPLGIGKNAGFDGGQLLGPGRSFHWDSIGAALLLVLIVSAVCVWRDSRRLPIAAAVLLATALAGNVVAAVNHPSLVQAMDREYHQRRQYVESVDRAVLEQDPMALMENGRVTAWGILSEDVQRGDCSRGVVYLCRSGWLIVWALLGVVLDARRTLSWRLRTLTIAGGVGAVLALLICSQRLTAEYRWQQARALEQQGDFVAARQAVDDAVTLLPELDRLERTTLLAGKIDNRLRRHTSAARFFLASQYARDRSMARPWTSTNDLPWQIPATRDWRDQADDPPVGPDRGFLAGEIYNGTPRTQRQPLHPLPARRGSGTDRMKDFLWARTLADEGLSGGELRDVAFEQSAEIWASYGVDVYLQGLVHKADRVVALEESEGLTTALDAWRRSSEVVPENRNARLYYGKMQARLHRGQPALAAGLLLPALENMGDLPINADIRSVLGDAYYQSGNFRQARRYFAESFDVYNIPDMNWINYRAQRRLGGY